MYVVYVNIYKYPALIAIGRYTRRIFTKGGGFYLAGYCFRGYIPKVP